VILLAEDAGSRLRPMKRLATSPRLSPMSTQLATLAIVFAFAAVVGPLGWMARSTA
jgi:hypothetical protein